MAHSAKVFLLGWAHAWNGIRAANSHSTSASRGSLLLRCIKALAKFLTARGFATISSTPSCALSARATSSPYNPVASITTLTRFPRRVRVRSKAWCPTAVLANRRKRMPPAVPRATTNSRALTSMPQTSCLSIPPPRSRLRLRLPDPVLFPTELVNAGSGPVILFSFRKLGQGADLQAGSRSIRSWP
jgi:hypothetical protein